MPSPTAHPESAAGLRRPLRPLRCLPGAVALLAFSGSARACSVCMGADDPQLANAANTVLWSLLTLVGFIFVATGGTAWYLWRRAQRPLPPTPHAIDCLASQPDEND